MCWSLTSTLAWPNPACWGSPGAGRCRAEWPRPAQPVFVSLQVSGSLAELGVRFVAGPPGRAGVPASWPTRTGLVGLRHGPQDGLVGQRCGLAGRFWWPTRTGAGGQCVDAPGQAGGQCRPRPRSVLESRQGASCQAHWACARFVPGYICQRLVSGHVRAVWSVHVVMYVSLV